MWGAIAAIGSAALGLLSSKKSSEASERASQSNAELMEKEAEYQKWRTGVELSRLEEYRKKVLGSQAVMFAKAGVNIEAGTPIDVFKETDRLYLMDRELIKKEGKFNVERARMGAASYLRDASAARTTGYIGMARTLLNVGGYAYDQGWLNFS